MIQKNETIFASTSAHISILQEIENDAALLFKSVPGYEYCADIPCRSQEEHADVLQNGVSLTAIDTAGSIKGFALILLIDRRPHLLELAVARNYQGHGTGKRLIQSTFEWVIKNNYSDITLTTFRHIPWNMPWYQRCGFIEFKPGQDRPELTDICRHEEVSEVGEMPRVAMIKHL